MDGCACDSVVVGNYYCSDLVCSYDGGKLNICEAMKSQSGDNPIVGGTKTGAEGALRGAGRTASVVV